MATALVIWRGPGEMTAKPGYSVQEWANEAAEAFQKARAAEQSARLALRDAAAQNSNAQAQEEAAESALHQLRLVVRESASRSPQVHSVTQYWQELAAFLGNHPERKEARGFQTMGTQLQPCRV
eukprot:CAMPEP_0171078466 /NCGR_PEP_ID=MMETSP0766_2-20121228/14662_1 /TAXON_ID=439317 /ORGANISM="Gambierdiscus australes, Strain CAWD 149" /LENGTH=123 /DNA_ID=CAMNT_0011535601 /DNA_START=15 /DNA_END=383 /DNA_ORIENTATION=-